MKQQRRFIFVLAVIFLLIGFVSQDLQAQSSRSEKKIGLHIGLLGDPFPTLIGFNANYNVTNWLRVTAGYGSVTASVTGGELKATTIGGGVRLFVPDWNFSPVGGISFASVSVSASGTGVVGDVGGFSGSASHMYATIGFDWQTGMGFNLGAGYNLSLKSGVGGLPYVNLGWYF